ncbi:hypothetical protein M407DRAFT_31767 [Tulasnella calospora MUT 4182]|uniref:Protein kinase domain-containing protein n=1 Tax=Tulasnella calospora MUT 4182 TaxID=1051891 RepID=A0A0C3Q5X2_9AGAM|nr:hypothetical protein M407DRAFT_31767 [Tulasnella calospora MUT 4182]
MSGLVHDEEQGGRPQLAGAQHASWSGQLLEQQRICPSAVLQSLNNLRIERTRIRPLGADSSKKGGNADVELAYLSSKETVIDNLESVMLSCVAVKKFRFDDDTVDDRVLARITHEINLLTKLSHFNIVELVGFVEDVKEGIAWMIFPWENNGNLREYLNSMNLEIPERVSLILDVAQGIKYLHNLNPPICHGDLKSLNVLVNSANRSILTDFGSARSMENLLTPRKRFEINPQQLQGVQDRKVDSLHARMDGSGILVTLSGPAWTVRWAAPELLDGQSPNLASDIWAFGWICWETVTDNIPFPEANEVTVVRRLATGESPQLGDNKKFRQTQALCSLIMDCWALDSSERPTAEKCSTEISWMNWVIPSKRDVGGIFEPSSTRLLRALGWMSLKDGHPANAQQYFRQALDVATSTGDKIGVANAVEALGEVCYMISDYPMAKAWYERAENECTQLRDALGLANVFKGLGDVYASESQYAQAESSYNLAYNLYRSLANLHGLGGVTLGRASIYHMKDLHLQAKALYVEALNIFTRIGAPFGIASAMKGLGHVYYMDDNYSKAEAHYTKARDIYNRIGDQHGVAQASQGLGNVYCLRNKYSDAKSSYTHAHEVYLRFKDQRATAHTILGQANVYLKTGLYTQAETLYGDAHQICNQINDFLGQAHAFKGLGDTYSARSQYSQARGSYFQARDIYARYRDHLGLGNVAKRLANLYYMQGQYSKAEITYIEARVRYNMGRETPTS